MGFGPADRDWIVITGRPDGGRQVQLAVTHGEHLMDIWQALAATGATLG